MAGSGLLSVIGVFLVSLLAIPLCMALSNTWAMQQPMLILAAGIVICFIMLPLAIHVLFVRNLRQGAYTSGEKLLLYMLIVFAFTCVVDSLLALTLDGVVSSMMFYLESGEPYLKTAHGGYINYWDGVAHYSMYLWMAYAIVAKRSYRLVGLFWVGSILNTMTVFLSGNVIGSWGTTIKPSYLLNIPYAAAPIWVACYLLSRRPAAPPSSSSNSKKPSWGFFRVVLALYLVGAMALGWWRFCVAMGSPLPAAQRWLSEIEPYLGDESAYPRLQAAIYALYGSPFQLLALVYLVAPHLFVHEASAWLVDLAAIHAGAYAQGQFVFVSAAARPFELFPTTATQVIPAQGALWFWIMHGALALGPQLLFAKLYLAHHGSAGAATSNTSSTSKRNKAE